MRRIFSIILTISLLCTSSVSLAKPKPKEIILNKKNINLNVGQKFKTPGTVTQIHPVTTSQTSVTPQTVAGIPPKKDGSNTQTEPEQKTAVTATPSYDHRPVFEVDSEKFVSRSDLSYEGLITNSPEGMPVANGRFGGPVWQNNNHSLGMQFNHTDTFMFNDASANSEWDYRSGSLGVLDIDFGDDVFSDDIVNHLSLYDARLNISDEDIDVNVISDVDSDTVLIDINDRRTASSMTKTDNVSDISYNNCFNTKSYEDVLVRNKKWWSDFWSKSYVYIPSQPDFEQRWTYYMYLAGISNRGKYPSKYNGGNWIAEGDTRDWGNYYWNWN